MRAPVLESVKKTGQLRRDPRVGNQEAKVWGGCERKKNTIIGNKKSWGKLEKGITQESIMLEKKAGVHATGKKEQPYEGGEGRWKKGRYCSEASLQIGA